MNTRHINTLSKTALTLSIVIATLGATWVQADGKKIVQLPRVVVTGKSLPVKAAEQTVVQLPRVVVIAHRRVDTQLASCAAHGQADKAGAMTQQC